MAKKEKSEDEVSSSASPPPPAALPLTTRLSIEISKPKDWQAFQRNCVLLFRAELNDPHAQEYGRLGQSQGGIDILARRNGHDDHFVGVQCKRIVEPLNEDEILTHARAALKLKAGITQVLERKVRRAAETGSPFIRVRDLFPQ